MKNCGTCAHWQQAEDPPDACDESGDTIYDEDNDYETIPVEGQWGWCKLVATFGPRQGSDKFYVTDGSHYWASLNTRSDVGCSEHSDQGEP